MSFILALPGVFANRPYSGQELPFFQYQPSDEVQGDYGLRHEQAGVLHIHSNRFAKMPRLSGESWVDRVRRDPDVRVAIAGDIYRVREELGLLVAMLRAWVNGDYRNISMHSIVAIAAAPAAG